MERRTWTAARIKRLRVHLDLTQQEFATRVGVTIAVVSRWENAHTVPARRARRALEALALEVAA